MASSGSTRTKPCPVCGRSFAWRHKWARCWDRVKNCSQRCARRRDEVRHPVWEHAILSLLATRSGAATVCPSEVARRERPDDWRGCMEAVRRAARRLVGQGEIEVVQGGRVVDAATARGPIRLRRRQ
ncbi:MAG: DUF2256 and DUF3253 domain-containing protein [Planctomycetes bacterium]|nr:DUF2256 and DUF3253 domain-containing protein [Planctomycetota bacterium]